MSAAVIIIITRPPNLDDNEIECRLVNLDPASLTPKERAQIIGAVKESISEPQ